MLPPFECCQTHRKKQNQNRKCCIQIIMKNHMFVVNCSHKQIILKSKKIIWVFPKIGVPPNHPFVHRVFHYFHHTFGGPTPIFGNTHMFLQWSNGFSLESHKPNATTTVVKILVSRPNLQGEIDHTSIVLLYLTIFMENKTSHQSLFFRVIVQPK